MPLYAEVSRAGSSPGPAGHVLAQAPLLQISRVLAQHLSAGHPPAVAAAGEACHHLPGQGLHAHMHTHTQDMPRQNTAVLATALMC